MTKQLFATMGYCPDYIFQSSSGKALSFSDVPPFLRTLLAADGTVTKSLEAYFWEPVGVCSVRQRLAPSDASLAEEFDLQVGDDLLLRDVELIGQLSGTHYVSAHSVFAVARLPKDIRSKLESQKIGIGEILRASGLETYRKIERLGLSAEGEVFRVYSIFIGGAPCIRIKETFPLAAYLSS